MAAYGVDVLDPAVSLRRVWVLLHNLPPGARRGGEAWSTEADLLAVLVDGMAYLTWITLKANGAKNVGKKPKPIDRPPRPGLTYSPEPGRGAARQQPTEGGTRAASWMDAAKQIAAVPGVVVSTDG
jgi:hypothetical protein